MSKKGFITFLVVGVILSSFHLQAQSNWEAGIRTDFGGVDIDVTIPFKAPRIHAAAYFGGGLGLGGYFDWMFSLNGGPAGLKFYPGVGPEFYFPNGGGFDMGIAGDFGAEYSFDFPLTVGIDWRPGIMLTGGGFYSGNWGLIARFRIGEGVSFQRSN